MFSKSLGLSFLGSTLAHGALLLGGGNLHTPARVEVQPAPTAMELIFSKPSSACHPKAKPKDLALSGEILRRDFVSPQDDTTKKAQDDAQKKVQDDTKIEKKKPIQETKKTPIRETPPSARPIPGQDIGSVQIGSSLKTHGPCVEQNFPPPYPRWARRQGFEGTALLKVFITQNGAAQKVEIKESSGYSILDEAAIKAVAQWKFYPAKKLGRNIPSELLIPIVFQIKG